MTERNEEQAERWDRAQGEHWVAEAERYGEMLKPFGERVLAALSAAPGERILDVGCGNGDLTLAVAEQVGPDGHVTGVDLSGPMLANARRRAAANEIHNVTFEQADAQVHEFEPDSFDAMCSRFGVMFFEDPAAAFANLGDALRTGGRLAFVCWQDLLINEYVMVPASAALEHVPVPDFSGLDGPGPFSLADDAKVRALLEGAGFVDVELEPVQAAMRMGSTAGDVVAFFHEHEFAEILLKDVPDDVAEGAWSAVRRAMEERASPEGVFLGGSAWVVGARREPA